MTRPQVPSTPRWPTALCSPGWPGHILSETPGFSSSCVTSQGRDSGIRLGSTPHLCPNPIPGTPMHERAQQGPLTKAAGTSAPLGQNAQQALLHNGGVVSIPPSFPKCPRASWLRTPQVSRDGDHTCIQPHRTLSQSRRHKPVQHRAQLGTTFHGGNRQTPGPDPSSSEAGPTPAPSRSKHKEDRNTQRGKVAQRYVRVIKHSAGPIARVSERTYKSQMLPP